jgi:hypothetical protein
MVDAGFTMVFDAANNRRSLSTCHILSCPRCHFERCHVGPCSDMSTTADVSPARHLPPFMSELPVDGYDDVAADCVAVMSNMSAFGELVRALEDDIATLVAHQQAVAKELGELSTVSLAALSDDVDSLYATACDLEIVFSRIDRLNDVMDGVHHVVMQLHAVVKRITEPTSVKERASGFLRSFGFGKSANDGAAPPSSSAAPTAPQTAAVSASARAAGIWSRVPANIVIDGCSPTAYHERVVTLLRKLATTATAAPPAGEQKPESGDGAKEDTP